MNLQQLEYFKVIAETKNFTTASSSLSVTQPALSKAISKLEAELNVPLFEREGRNIKITKFGETFLKYAELALDDIEKGIEKIQDMKKNNEMLISIGSTPCIGSSFIPFIISSFLNKNLEMKFNFNNEDNDEILKDLKYGKIDLGFFDKTESISKYPEIEFIPIKKEEYVVIVSKNHYLSNREEVSLKELKDESFVVYSNEQCDKLISYSEFIDYTPKISVQPSDVSMLVGLVAAGAGITISLNTPMLNTNKISILKIKEKIGYKTIYMGWKKSEVLSKGADKFKNHVIDLYKNDF